MLGPREHSCAFCRQRTNPEALYAIHVPLVVRTPPRVCAACREEFQSGGRQLLPCAPTFTPLRVYRWCGPLGEDALAFLEEARAALGDTEAPESATAPLESTPRRWWQFWRGAGVEVASATRTESTRRLDLRTRAADALPALRARLGLTAEQPLTPPSELDLALALAAAVVADQELGPRPKVERLAQRLSREDATDVLVGLYAHQRARHLTEALLGAPAVRAAMKGPKLLAGLPALGEFWLSCEPLAEAAHAEDPELWSLLELARRSYRLYLPYTLQTPLQARVGALYGCILLERGDQTPGEDRVPPERDKSAFEVVERLAREFSEVGEDDPALRDPRLPLLRALVRRAEGNLGGADAELEVTLRWIAEAPHPEAWVEVEASAQLATYLRAAEAGRWNADARAALARCCRLRPGDRRLLLELAHAYLQSARPEVAREVLERRSLANDDVSAAEVSESVAGVLAEARPNLEAYYRDDPSDAEARLLFATCLVRLEEPDEAWRVLDGDALLDSARAGDEGSSRQAELQHLAALVAAQKERVRAATTLLRASFAGETDHANKRHVRRNLVTVLLRDLRDRLLDLEERARPLADALAEARADGSTPEEVARLQEELQGVLLGGDEALSHQSGLVGLLDFLREHEDALRAEFSPLERDRLAWFVGRELLEGFSAQAGFGPDLLDSKRLSSTVGKVHQAYRSLALRRLPEALRHAAAAFSAGASPLPIELTLRVLSLIQAGGEPTRVWALHVLSMLTLPFDLGVIPVTADALDSLDITLVDRLMDTERAPGDLRPGLGRLQGRFRLAFELDVPPEELPRVPQVRRYVAALFEAHPDAPFLLDPRSRAGQFRLVFGALASPDALLDEDPGLALEDASLLPFVARCVNALDALGDRLGLDRRTLPHAVLSAYSADRLRELLDRT